MGPSRPHLTEDTSPSPGYRRLQPELAALRVSELLTVDVNVSNTVGRVRSALGRARTMNDDPGSAGKAVDAGLLDKLEECTDELELAQTRCVAASAVAKADAPHGAAAKLMGEANEMRKLLMAHAVKLCRHGLLKPSQVSTVKGRPGYVHTTQELASIVSVLCAAWPRIQSVSTLSAADLNTASELVAKLRCAQLLEARLPMLLTAREQRARAFTLLVRTYAGVRQALAEHWDAAQVDALMPPLSGRTSVLR